jgi:hypothetical protein
MDIQIILACYLMLNIVASNLGLNNAIPIKEHEVVPPSDFKLTPESKNFNITVISMTTASYYTAGNPHMQNSWFCKEIREDNFRFWWRRVHEDASQGMYIFSEKSNLHADVYI